LFFRDKPNILIVDDNSKNIQLAANVLKSTDLYTLFFALSGEKAFEQLKLRSYALILLDINMPGLNGYEVALILKQNPQTTHIPIIFLSANANHESIRKGFENGGEDYITKPFDDLELIHRVKTHVSLFCAREKLQEEVNDTRVFLEQYKVAIDASASVSKSDLEGNITYVNDRFCELSKYSREELLGKNHTLFRDLDSDPKIYQELWETIQAKKNWTGLLKNIAKDGSFYYFEATIVPLLNFNQEIIEYIAIRTDVTKEIKLKEDIIETQKEVLFTLGELGERRSEETGEHVKRVALFCEVLAEAYGCSKEDTALLKMASPMHDIGKVIIPDAILLKSTALLQDEFEIMKKHTSYGWDIFNKSEHELLKAAAIIAHQHHEKYDGSGYPRGLKADEIHIFGRITAIADVFDALSQNRVYKNAWSTQETFEYIEKQSGKSFDPQLVRLFLNNKEAILKIKDEHC